MRPSRRLPAVLAVVLAGAMLAACGKIQTNPGWSPPDPAAPEISLSGTASTSSPALEGTSGLDVRLLYNPDPAAGLGARWAEVPGNDGFNRALRDAVKGAIDAQAAATGVPYYPAAVPARAPGLRECTPGSASRPAAELLADPAITPETEGPSVTVVCEIVAASGPVLAEALRIITAVGGQVQTDGTTIYYADTSGAFSARKDSLISDEGLRTLLARVVQSLKVSAGALEPEMQEDPAAFPIEQLRSWFSNFTLGADGSLTVQLPDDFSTPELDRLADVPKPSPLIATVPAEAATPLLSPEGAQVQAALASPAPFAPPVAPYRGQEAVDCTLFACIALTYDDGPGPYTAAVLDALDSRRAAATFFVQGVYLGRWGHMLLRMRDEGHQIANHTWSHPNLTKLSAAQVTSQITRNNDAIEAITGSAPTMFRPPYGAYNATVLAAAPLPAIIWSRDTGDWMEPGEDVLFQRAVTNARPGDIVLLHDIHEPTARATPRIIDGLLARGFTLVTVEQILGGIPAQGTATKR